MVTTFDPLVVASPLSSAAVIADADPRTRPVSVLAVPVPPLATVSVALSPVAVPDVFWFKVGMSPDVMERNAGAPVVANRA
jgi:hypothetical protein